MRPVVDSRGQVGVEAPGRGALRQGRTVVAASRGRRLSVIGSKRQVERCGYMCYGIPVSRSVSVRELRNTVSEVLRQVEGGEKVTVTVDRRPVAELVPLRRRQAVPVEEALIVVSRHAADPRLEKELRELLSGTTDDV